MDAAAGDGLPLYTAAGTRALDRRAIASGLPGRVLMARAGRAAFDLLERRFGGPRPLEVLCGTGNNGGDGFVVARLAHERRWPVRAWLVGDPARVRGEALEALEALRSAGLEPQPFSGAGPAPGALLVDALLGTGLGGEVRDAQARAIDWCNASACPVLAIDVPSGLCSDTGAVLGRAVRADATISFIGRKRGLYTGAGAGLRGEAFFDALGVPADVLAAEPPAAWLLAAEPAPPAARSRDAHKGHFGHVLVIGGNTGMAGAALMAAEAAARSGAGLVSVAVRPGNEAALLARRPELMVRGVSWGHELEPLLERATVIVAGPGIGQDAWAQQMLLFALRRGLPAVLDADALNLLAAGRVAAPADAARRWVLTPHPGEAARLLGCTAGEVGRDRFAALGALLARYPGTVVLKGAGSLVGTAGEAAPPAVCAGGNPGMASGGMGDVLSGLLGGLIAQGLAQGPAARLGVAVHARAADLAAAAEGERGLLATDLLPWIRRLLNPGTEA